MRQRTTLVNALRRHMAELGVIAPQRISGVADLVAVLMGENTTSVPALAKLALHGLAAELAALGNRVKEIEAAILAWHEDNEASRRLATIPGMGPITASAIVATITDPPSSTPPGGLLPGSGWRLSRTVTAASNAKAASPSRASEPCGGCLCSVQRR